MNKVRFGLVVLILASLVGVAYIIGLIVLASPPPPLVFTPKPYSGKPITHFRGGNVQEGKLVHSVSPSYPELARQMRWRPPFVNMEVTVGEDGKVSNVKFLRGHPLCNEAIKAALSQWKYTPVLIMNTAKGTPKGFTYALTLRCGDPYRGKLDPNVAVLIDRIRRKGSITHEEFSFVSNGMVDLELTLSNSRKQNIDKLERLGFITSGPANGTALMIGRLPIAGLDALRLLQFISFIAPHRS